MIHRLNVFLLSLIVTFAPVYFTTVHASAAEKWEYEPVMKDMNIHVKGYKVDQYGNAVNDYEYNTKIDPKTTANRKKMGTVGFGRLLKTTGWGLLGSAALEGLLESVDWVIDPETQSIWRNKKPKNDSSGVSEALCKGGTLKNYSAQDVKILYWTSTHTVGDCPLQAAESLLKYYSNTDGRTYEFIRWLPEKDVDAGYLYYRKVFLYKDPQYGNREAVVQVKTGEVVQPNPEKEYLTEEELADYANHTHPDYSNPELAPKLEPKYSPNIASDLWKPSNQWEEVNSPTVQEAQRKLDQAQPEPKKDAEIKPNPETGGSVLPKFCDWAAPVCDAIKWFKETPDLQDEPLNIEDKQVIDYEHINYVQFGASCPFSPQAQSLPMGVLGSIDFETDLTFICSFGVEAKPYIVGLGHLGALIFLLIGIRNGNG